MKELVLKPFTEKNPAKKYTINEFIELGIPFAMLIPKKVDDKTAERYPIYKFGIRLHNGSFFWFFEGEFVAENRTKAKEVFQMLLKYNDTYNLGTVFSSK